MKNSSPLRYPGGKSAMSSLLAGIRRLNGLGATPLAEPFAGGAGASLTLLFHEETPEIFINDADPAIFDFWWALSNRSGALRRMISQKKINMTEWRRQRDIYLHSRARLKRAFATFYLNRCNRSGIIMNGGPIGGVEQRGEWKLDARFNKEELIRRCERVAEYRDRVHISGEDGISFIKSRGGKSKFYFIDPPYFEKGKTLYLNALTQDYHLALANQLRGMTEATWVVTYDDCPQIRKMYRGWANIRPFSLRYAASERRSGKEILITPKGMRLPKYQDSAAIGW